jgi:RNA-directed DNA polymerase
LLRPYSKKQLNIRSLKHLALRLGISIEELQEVAEQAETHYKTWREPKKNGGFRQISAPTRRLKRIQRAIHKLLMEIELPNCVHYGRIGRSNLTNARVHSGKKWVYGLDFRAFFPSISHHFVYNMFRQELNCTPVVSSILTRLCTFQGQVPQGGSMSTDIANIVCRKLDKRLENLGLRYGIQYSIYCDDLNFSGHRIPRSFRKKVKEIVGQYPFSLNPDKESLSGRHRPQVVTGLTVNRKRPHVPRKKRREWRKEKHIFEKHESGSLSETERLNRQQRLRGKTAYLNYVNHAF